MLQSRMQTKAYYFRIIQFIACVLIAFLLRFPTFGNTNIHTDEDFYLLVGQMMHHGAIPYVDVWDRKPFGLFLIYFLFASCGISPVFYQISAWLSVSVTAFLVIRIAERISGSSGALFAGALYIGACTAFGGIGGQAEVFCNVFIATGFWLIIRNLARLSSGTISREVHCAMLFLGASICVKQTAIFPSAFIGLMILYLLHRSGSTKLAIARVATLFILAGIAPSSIIAGAYWFNGHWPEFFHAMVTSNLTKGHEPPAETRVRQLIMAARLLPLTTLSLISLILLYRQKFLGQLEAIVTMGWLASASLGLLAIPNYFIHYALPLALPLAILSAPLLNRGWLGLIIAFPSITILGLSNFPFDLSRVQRSNENMIILANAMRNHAPRGTALIFDGPVYLYAMSGLKPLSPLVLPNHLSEETERNVSQFNTTVELNRILANKPGTVVISAYPSSENPNAETWRLVSTYISRNCHLVESRIVSGWESGDGQIRVYGDCAVGLYK